MLFTPVFFRRRFRRRAESPVFFAAYGGVAPVILGSTIKPGESRRESDDALKPSAFGARFLNRAPSLVEPALFPCVSFVSRRLARFARAAFKPSAFGPLVF